MSTIDLVDRRVFAAIRLLDAVTGAPIQGAVTVSSDEVELQTNRSGLVIVTGLKRPSATGLMAESELTEFVASRGYSLQLNFGAAPPSSLPFNLEVSDRSGRYLSRRCALRIVARSLSDPLARPTPFDRDMMPSPIMQAWPGSAVLRVTVTQAGVRLPGVLLLIRRSTGVEVLARSMTDENGEGLVLIPRLPVSTWVDTDRDGQVDAGEVTTSATSLRLAAIFDPSNWDASARSLLQLPEPDLLQATAGLPRRLYTLSAVAGGTYRQIVEF